MLGANYPFLDAMWTMMMFFLWIAWFWLLFTIWADLFRRHDVNGWAKTGWFAFTIILPFLGAFVYLVSQSDGMTERNVAQARAQKEEFDTYVRETAAGNGGNGGGPAKEIESAKRLLDSGAITQDEFEEIKRRALAAA